MKHLKEKCISCDCTGKKMNKEHIFPVWLIQKTKTHKTKIRWVEGKKVGGLSATIPICEDCNKLFGEHLEAPVARIFDDLEEGKGISDYESELLIRWLWKIDGLIWKANHPNDLYSDKYTLKERVLNPIDEIRPHLILAISRIQTIDLSFDDLPMGIDSQNEVDAIFVSGVFSRLAIMVVFEDFESLIPINFSTYRLLPKRNSSSSVKIYYPKAGFVECTEAVGITIRSSFNLSKAHDSLAQYHLGLK